MNIDIKATRDENGVPILGLQVPMPEIGIPAIPILRLFRRQFPAEFDAVAREIVTPAAPGLVLPEGLRMNGSPPIDEQEGGGDG